MRFSILAIALGLGISSFVTASEAQADGYVRKVRVHRMHVHKVAHERCDLVGGPRAVLTRDGFRWRRVYVCRAWS